MNLIFRNLSRNNATALNTVKLTLKREMDSIELRQRHAIELLSGERRTLKTRLRDLEVEVAGLRNGISDDNVQDLRRRIEMLELCSGASWLEERKQLLARVSDLEERVAKGGHDRSIMDDNYRALEATYTQLKAAVANAKSMDELSWVQI